MKTNNGQEITAGAVVRMANQFVVRVTDANPGFGRQFLAVILGHASGNLALDGEGGLWHADDADEVLPCVPPSRLNLELF